MDNYRYALISFSAVVFIGILECSLLSKRVNTEKLEVALAWFIGLTAFVFLPKKPF